VEVSRVWPLSNLAEQLAGTLASLKIPGVESYLAA
jgi:hypothetical protein